MKVSLWVRKSAFGADICNDVLYVLWFCIVTSGETQVLSDEEARDVMRELCSRKCVGNRWVAGVVLRYAAKEIATVSRLPVVMVVRDSQIGQLLTGSLLYNLVVPVVPHDYCQAPSITHMQKSFAYSAPQPSVNLSPKPNSVVGSTFVLIQSISMLFSATANPEVNSFPNPTSSSPSRLLSRAASSILKTISHSLFPRYANSHKPCRTLATVV